MKAPCVITGALSLMLVGTAAAAEQDGPYPDFGFDPPASYDGPLFQLSQDFPDKPPEKLPAFFDKLPESFDADFETWQAYIEAAGEYCLEGNVAANWRVEDNSARDWYHMPWQHYGESAREFIHGLTKEAPIQPRQLAITQTDPGVTYAVGIFNAFGGYALGKVWADPLNPDPSVVSAPNSFPNGTVICKPLFVDIAPAEVPFLHNPVQWDAYIVDSFSSNDRSVGTVSLIQMDFAVRDERVPETGWLFGTFQYNGEHNPGGGWDNLVPLGIQWGNDPEVTSSTYTNPTPVRTEINPELEQSVINPGDGLPPTHLGWNARMVGPVDNPKASCMSCHMTAEFPQVSPINPTFLPPGKAPKEGSKAWMRWFGNLPAGEPFDKGAISTDYSLQLSEALQNYYQWRCLESGYFADGDKTGQWLGDKAPQICRDIERRTHSLLRNQAQ
ncbi:hypothetical protein [Arhodomonas sp. AD133]|uniref:hypothetical protein n=1 Tax=Arhodomonas sp. AD133 TaxID=3415009 RepID=UPI003EB8A88B